MALPPGSVTPVSSGHGWQCILPDNNQSDDDRVLGDSRSKGRLTKHFYPCEKVRIKTSGTSSVHTHSGRVSCD